MGMPLFSVAEGLYMQIYVLMFNWDKTSFNVTRLSFTPTYYLFISASMLSLVSATRIIIIIISVPVQVSKSQT